jgi:predicted metal-dependent HD superfamily phosphohydrolase
LRVVLSELCERFAALVRRLGGRADAAPAALALLASWAEPHRVYHGTPHLVDCLARLDEMPAAPDGEDLIEAALWYHDAAYDPRAGDNEERSAAWAVRDLSELGVSTGDSREVARLVRLTRHDVPPVDPRGQVVVDIDLSILGRAPHEFDEYEAAIRAEYAWVPDSEFRGARKRILSGFLAREPLYAMPWFRGRYEKTARANLQRLMASLEAR